jgi:hypothetical protein
MAQSTDIASVVGTWVAAGVAIIALLGVVGPLLIWRASRTERNRAIDLLTGGEAETGACQRQDPRFSRWMTLFRLPLRRCQVLSYLSVQVQLFISRQNETMIAIQTMEYNVWEEHLTHTTLVPTRL